MALEIATYQQILTILTQLATNYTSLFTDYYNMFYNETPMDITLKIYDAEGNLIPDQDGTAPIVVPNRAKDRTYLLNGTGEPENFVTASRGATYQDLTNGRVYIKLAGDGTANGWSPIITQANVDDYVLQGEGSPEGIVESSRGIVYVDILNALIYIKTTPTGNTGWVGVNAGVVNPANADLSNLTPTGELHFANPSLSNLNSTGQQKFEGKEDKSNKTTTINSSSTNTQYPSAKAVYNQLALKEDKSNKVTTINSSSTDDQYPSARAVYIQMGSAESVNNKTTTINSSSTNVQYPSAKAVYDQLALKEDKSNKTTTINSSSTDVQYPSAKATYSFVSAEIENVKNPKVIQLTGTIPTLTDNARHAITITGDTTFTLPTVTDNTIFHQMLVEMSMPTVRTIQWGTDVYFWGEAPDLTNTGSYTVIYEYDLNDLTWVVGALYKSAEQS